MNFVSMNRARQQTDGVDAQDASRADSSAEAPAFQRQLSETAVPSAPVLMQVRAHPSDASRSEARPIMRSSGHPHTPAPHGEGGGPMLSAAPLMEPSRIVDGAAQHSASHGAVGWPEVLVADGHDQDQLWGMMDEPSPSSSEEPIARRQATDAQASFHHVNWQHDHHGAADGLMGASGRNNFLSDEEILNDEHDAANSRPTRGDAIERHPNEIANSRSHVRMQSWANEVSASSLDPQAMMLASGHERILARHAGEDEALQTAQSNGVLVGRSKEPLYAEDALLISGLKEALLRGGAAASTATSNVGFLLGLGRWLFANDKPGIAARLHDESMDNDVEDFIAKRGTVNVRWALAHLRTSQSTGGVAPIAARPDLTPYPEDRALIKEYKKQAVTAGTSGTANTYATLLKDFSHHLRANNLPGIAARLHDETWNEDESLNEEIKRFKDAGGHRSIGAALDHLREGARKPNVAPLYSEDAALISGLQDALVEAGYKEITATTNYVRPLRRFGRWLFASKKPGIAARLNDESLDRDAEIFDKSRWRLVLTALDRLRASQSAGRIASITDPAGGVQAATKQGGSQPAFSWPAALSEGDDQDSFFGTVDQAGASSCLQPPRHGLALDPAESLLPSNRRHHDQEPTDERHTSTVVPGEQVLISDEPDVGDLRSAKRKKTLSDPQGAAIERQVMRPPSRQLEAPPSQRRAPMPSRAHEYASAAHPVARHVRDTARQHTLLRDAVSWPLVLPKAHAQNQLPPMAEGSPSWPALVAPEQLQGAERAEAQEPARSTSTWSPQMPLDFDWSMWPSSETAASLPVPAQLPSRSYESRDDVMFPSTLNKVAPGSLLCPAEDAELLAKFRVDAERRKLTSGAINNSVYGLGVFVRWLHANNKGPLAARLRDCSSLDEEISAYKSLGRDPQNRIKSALDVLRRLLRDGEEAEAPEPRVLGRPRQLVPHPEDAPLIEDALRRSLNDLRTPTAKLRQAAQQRARRLRALSAWLKKIGRGTITGRLNGSSEEQSKLDHDVLAFQRTGARIHGPDLSHLRSYLKLIEANRALGLQVREQPSSLTAQGARQSGSAQELPPTPATPSAGAWAWLGEQMQEPASPSTATAPSRTYGGLKPFVGLNLPTPSELRDDAVFAPAPSGKVRSDTYSGLESFVDLNAPTPSELRDDAHFAPAHPARARSDTYGGLKSFVDLNEPTPSELRDDAQFAPAHPARARSDTYGGLESFVDLNALTPSELRDDAHFAPAHPARARSDTYGGLESFVDLNAPTPSELRDDAHFAPAHPAGARSDTYGNLESFVDLNAPTPSELRDDAQFAPAHPAGARSDTYAGLEPIVDLNAPMPSEWDDEVDSARAFPAPVSGAQIGGLDPTVPSRGPGLVLQDMQWLGDEHIQRDYELLERWLHDNHPDLAARMQLVDPLVAHYHLRLAAGDSDARRRYQGLIDRNGNDTADFLFLPMNDADRPNQRGSHWSLLFVDRSNRQRPVAYHYDSILGYNEDRAAKLAKRLGVSLSPADMAQQENSYDCGVFVVDGTRALVRRLAQGERPEHEPLHLDNLVANRQCLQDRLRAHPGLG
ncbi:Ulp1 protease family, C-terminal catalytic domain [Bradyrhizobium brasilense]|uniref:Ulp1 protease family, C-terminal catalytic domain n=1 Tax=Bradyrhizobium brasilense TaxID=1419277 RepID=A0A1G7F0P7_9BRAD|nr:Ulp1 family isopeptidase [Bradyrhizobium brasilense]SDE69471.1 Ulp1 protease family, C-terminal catalytic domain [Bradyrhizobium brasilense]